MNIVLSIIFLLFVIYFLICTVCLVLTYFMLLGAKFKAKRYRKKLEAVAREEKMRGKD
jgi:hypothetical protein